MIIQAFSDYIKQFDDEISTNVLLFGWLKYKLSKMPENNVDKVIHKEISILSDKNYKIIFAGNSETGRNLLTALYNFADSYEQQKFTRWVHNLKASDFKH